jgi:tetratricopeptide (TPR) repeat protein
LQQTGAGRTNPKLALTIAIFTGLLAYGGGAVLDTAIDRAPGRSYTVAVEDKRESSGRSTSYYLDLTPWGDRPAQEVRVPSRLYRQVGPGATVCVERHPGGLGAPWFEVDGCASPQARRRDQDLKAGNALMGTGQYLAARMQFDKAVLADPGSDMGWAARAVLEAMQGDTAAAAADAAKARSLNPGDIVALRAQGLVAERLRRPRDALAAYGRAITLEPRDGFSLTRRAVVEGGLGDFAAAIKDADNELAMYPADRFALLIKGSAQSRLGRRDDVKREAATLDANSTEQGVLFTRAELLSMAQDRAGAMVAIDRAIDLKPSAAAYVIRARLRLPADQTQASDDARAALKLDPGSAEAASLLAWFSDKAGDDDEAVSAINRAIAALPNDADLYALRVEYLVKAGRTSELPLAYDAERTRIAGDPERLNSLCWSEAVQGIELEQALADCGAALKIKPGFSEVLDSQAFVLLRLGRNQAALDAYTAALKIQPKLAMSLRGRSIAEERLGMSAAAAADVAAARMSDPQIDQHFPTNAGVPRAASQG